MRENGVRSRNHNEEEYARKHSDFDVKTIIIPVKPKRSIKPFEQFLKMQYKKRPEI